MAQIDGLSKFVCLVAELTHRCPLGCPYCCNPLALERREQELDVATWSRLFREAASLGMRHVYLSGGEPGERRDLVDIAANAREAGLCTHLITSGVGISTRTLRDLWEAGLDHIHVSFQDADAVSADRIAGARGAFQRKYALAAETVRLGLPLTVNVVLHRANIDGVGDMVGLALALKADRIEIVPVQYVGWALRNRAALMPAAEQVSCAAVAVDELRRKHRGRIVIDMVSGGPAGLLAGGSLTVTPSGRVLPCRAAESIAGLEVWNVLDYSLADIWANSPAFNTFRAAAIPSRDAGIAELASAPSVSDYVHRRM